MNHRLNLRCRFMFPFCDDLQPFRMPRLKSSDTTKWRGRYANLYWPAFGADDVNKHLSLTIVCYILFMGFFMGTVTVHNTPQKFGHPDAKAFRFGFQPRILRDGEVHVAPASFCHGTILALTQHQSKRKASGRCRDARRGWRRVAGRRRVVRVLGTASGEGGALESLHAPSAHEARRVPGIAGACDPSPDAPGRRERRPHGKENQEQEHAALGGVRMRLDVVRGGAEEQDVEHRVQIPAPAGATAAFGAGGGGLSHAAA